MKAYEFPATVTPEGMVELPSELRDCLLNQPLVRVIILVDEVTNESGEAAWSELTANQFLAGYDKADAAYDHV